MYIYASIAWRLHLYLYAIMQSCVLYCTVCTCTYVVDSSAVCCALYAATSDRESDMQCGRSLTTVPPFYHDRTEAWCSFSGLLIILDCVV